MTILEKVKQDSNYLGKLLNDIEFCPREDKGDTCECDVVNCNDCINNWLNKEVEGDNNADIQKEIKMIDDLGRLHLSKKIRNPLNLDYGDKVEVYVDGNKVCCKKYENLCPHGNDWDDCPDCRH